MALRMMLDLDSAAGDAARLQTANSAILEVILSAWGQAEHGLREDFTPWRPPIHKTVATRKEGIGELADAIQAHRAHLEESGGLAWRERERAAAELETIIQQESLRSVLARIDGAELSELVGRIVDRKVDAFTACQQLLKR